MNLRGRKKRQPPFVDITPLVDVVFLMLIFFMVSTTFETAAKLRLELPSAASEERASAPKQVVISIDKDGRIFVQDEYVPDDRFEDRVLYYTKGDPNVPVLLRADANARHKRVVFALDHLSRLGLGKVGIAVAPEKER